MPNWHRLFSPHSRNVNQDNGEGRLLTSNGPDGGYGAGSRRTFDSGYLSPAPPSGPHLARKNPGTARRRGAPCPHDGGEDHTSRLATSSSQGSSLCTCGTGQRHCPPRLRHRATEAPRLVSVRGTPTAPPCTSVPSDGRALPHSAAVAIRPSMLTTSGYRGVADRVDVPHGLQWRRLRAAPAASSQRLRRRPRPPGHRAAPF